MSTDRECRQTGPGFYYLTSDGSGEQLVIDGALWESGPESVQWKRC